MFHWSNWFNVGNVLLMEHADGICGMHNWVLLGIHKYASHVAPKFRAKCYSKKFNISFCADVGVAETEEWQTWQERKFSDAY